MKFNASFLSILFILSTLLISCDSSKRKLVTEDLTGGFELLPPEQTGIDFNNSITESTYFNHFYFSQIYSGAGVAVGDLNNDGLSDIFFCGNQVGDKLYLNKGDFKFEDITISSKISRSPGWSWGVTMADVNSDGYLDIYVSRNGESMSPADRKNKLFINNKDLTFTESSRLYGLDDAGFSTQSVFFDMDRDGDLDMYQVNQPADTKLFLRHDIRTDSYKYFKDRFYINENGKYKDVSKEVGISNNFKSFGLSVTATDFNNDNWIDLYVANDYGEPDFLYENNGDGTFTNVINETMNHISHLSMGSDSGDINNDGLFDLLTIDMSSEDHYRSKTNMQSMNVDLFNSMVNSGKHYQYMINTLQVNTGKNGFSDIANLAGISRTDWSWSGLLIDLDNDSWKDILITNGIKKDVLNNDYISYINNLNENISENEFFNVTKKAPSLPLPNYAYKNTGNLKFENVSKKWGFDFPSFSSGMAYGDLDNDGDLDVVINNMEQPAFVYENKATGNFLKIKLNGSEKNKFGVGVKANIYHNGKKQVAQNIVTRGYFSSVEPGLFFGLGKDTKVDSVKVIWPNEQINFFEDINANTTITANYSKANEQINKPSEEKTLLSEIYVGDVGLNYIHKENEFDDFKEEILLPHKLSTNGPFSATSDVNGDGLEDLFIGGATKQEAVLYFQTENGDFKRSVSNPWKIDKNSEDLEAVFFDIDNDGDQDLYVASGGSEFKQGNSLLKDRVYINDGFGNFTKKEQAVPNIFESTQTVKVSDIDGDGDLDLFVGTRLIPGKYTYPASSYILINENGVLKKAAMKIAPDLEKIGMVSDAVFSDIDGDGDDDLLIVGEWMTIQVLENTNGRFNDASKKYGLDETSRGIWWSISASDLDNDGDDDYIIGNLGKNNKFKATKEHPFKVYANDFDGNGTNDIVLAKFYKTDYVPMRGKECTTQQMPYVGEKFKDFHSFASSKLIDILPEKKVDEAVVYEISNFESILLVNNKGKLVPKPLPVEAQVSPIKSSVIDDFNNDGHKDLFLVGNHYGVEVETTRYDAGYGSLLLGDGNNNFKFSPPVSSGIYIQKDSRSISPIKTVNKDIIYLITNNNNSLSLFKKNN